MKLLRITSAAALEGFRVRLTLDDGSIIERDLEKVLRGPMFDPLRANRAEFESVRVVDGGLEWANGAGLCPDFVIWAGVAPRATDARPQAFLEFSGGPLPPPLSRDTDPRAEAVQMDILRRMSEAEKVALVMDANRCTEELTMAGLRMRHPEAGPAELRRRLFGLLLGEELAERAFGPLDQGHA